MSPSAIAAKEASEHKETDRQEPSDRTGSATPTATCSEMVGNEESGEDDNERLESSDDESEPDDSGDSVSDSGSEDSWEGEPAPLELNYDALKHIADLFLPGAHGTCVEITTLKRGTFHEARVLHFEDGWSCIGRFTRNPEVELLAQAESALATMAYVRRHTTIPVPQIYFVNHSPNHVVGSTFVLMEHMPGVRLSDLWLDLGFEDRLSVVGQIADVLGQLAELKFNSVGCLRDDGTIGPLLSTTGEARRLGDHAFTTTEERAPSIPRKQQRQPTLNAPYRLIHGDFESQNILVQGEEGALRISGIIDWDWSHTGLLYHLCEYPDYIRDFDGEEDDFEVNRILRKQFVSSLAKHFSRDSADREQVKQCFREKNYAMNSLRSVFMYCTWAPDLEKGIVESYLNGLCGESPEYERRAYGGVLGWEPDSEPESESE